MSISFLDYLLALVYLVVFLFCSKIYAKKKEKENPIYEYYTKGLAAKFIGCILFCLIYIYYYGGGDTILYHQYSVNLNNLFYKSPGVYLKILFGDTSPENFYEFDSTTGDVGTYIGSPETYFVVRIMSVIQFFSFQNYLTSSIIVAFISYMGIWKLFMLLNIFYPTLQNQFKYSVLFFPSPLFWGSGIMKDTFTYMAVCWFTYSFYKIFISREKVFLNVILLIISGYLMIRIKPYIFIALLPGVFVWLNFQYLKDIKNWLIKILAGPLIAVIVGAFSFLIFSNLQEQFGQYSSTDKILEKAVNTQKDLKADYYHGNSFDIGDFDGSVESVITKIPQAIVAGLFRPFLWESKNIVMLMAGIENTLLLVTTFFFLIKIGPIRLYKLTASQPILFFSILFSIFFAFSIGLTTSNFGALVRYKIPCIPFYFSALLIINNFYRKNLN